MSTGAYFCLIDTVFGGVVNTSRFNTVDARAVGAQRTARRTGRTRVLGSWSPKNRLLTGIWVGCGALRVSCEPQDAVPEASLLKHSTRNDSSVLKSVL